VNVIGISFALTRDKCFHTFGCDIGNGDGAGLEWIGAIIFLRKQRKETIDMTRCRIAFVFVLSLFLALQLPLPTTGPSIAHAGGTITIDDVRSITIGMGLRTSFNTFQYGAPDGTNWSKDFAVDDLRLYLSGQMLKHVTFEFNTEYQRIPALGTQTATSGNVRILDGIVKFGFNDYVNIWMGQFLPPSDRSNLSGPFYLNAWDFPFVQKYPAVFAGRDDGAAIWGQIKGGMFKYQFGAFEGLGHCAPYSAGTACATTTPNQKDSLLYAGRLTLNLWDPEPGYYNSSTYYGAKNVLAIGLVGMHQTDAAGTPANFANFDGWNVDFLAERNLGEAGVPTVEFAFYSYNYGGVIAPVVGDSPEGSGYFVLGSYLLPWKMGMDDFKGRLQPMARYQQYDNGGQSTGEHKRLDIALSYVLDGHNARITADYALNNPESGAGPRANSIQLGLQFQL
jgi:hypothetical protein